MLICSDEDNVGENKQLKLKLLEHYIDHIILSMLKGMRMLFALEMWLSASSMKNYYPLSTALKTKLSGLCIAKIKCEILGKKYDCKF